MPNTQTMNLKGVFLFTRRLLYPLKGILPFLLILGNLILWIGPLFLLSLVKFMVPFQTVRGFLYNLMTRIYVIAAWIDNLILWRMMGLHLEIRGLEELYRDKIYLVLANHQSWADILILQSLLSLKAPIPKFITKKQILYLPLVGMICWAYDFPIVKRYSKKELQERPDLTGKDRQAIQNTLKRFHETPGSIVNFAEGTRYSPSKARRYQSPYRSLLSPRVGGLYVILQAMGDRLHEVLDLTLAYDCPKLSFWDFLSGKCRHIIVQARHIAPDQIFEKENSNLKRLAPKEVAQWMQRLWEEKDKQLIILRNELNQERLNRNVQSASKGLSAYQGMMNRRE